jgi:type I restriction enzyme S subunit
MEVKPGYKQTEVGAIPVEWELRKLPEVSWFQEGPGLRNWQFTSSGMKVINVTNLEGGVLNLERTDRHISILEFKRTYQHFAIDAADIVMASSGNSYSKTAVVREHDLPLVMNTSVIRFKPAKAIEYNFLWALLNSPLFKNQIDLMITGGAQPNFGPYHLKRVNVPVPPPPEQRAIAGALSDVDGLIGALDQLIAKKSDLKQAAMQQLLTGHQRLTGFHDVWEFASFGSVFTKVNAKEHQVQTSEYQATGIFPIVDQGKDHVVGFSDREDKRFHCPKDGVVIFGDHTCIVKFVDFDFVVGADGTQILGAKVGHCARFHAFELQHRGIPTTGYNRHFKFLKDRTFVGPPLSEQTAIAEVLSDMDAELEALEQRRDKTRALKQGMMQELLTGRTRLVDSGKLIVGS